MGDPNYIRRAKVSCCVSGIAFLVFIITFTIMITVLMVGFTQQHSRYTTVPCSIRNCTATLAELCTDDQSSLCTTLSYDVYAIQNDSLHRAFTEYGAVSPYTTINTLPSCNDLIYGKFASYPGMLMTCYYRKSAPPTETLSPDAPAELSNTFLSVVVCFSVLSGVALASCVIGVVLGWALFTG